MIPILYKADETEFKTYGIGALSDIITCSVTEERNSTYECVFTYPITGAFYSEIQNERIIKAKPNDTSADQAFRISQSVSEISTKVSDNESNISVLQQTSDALSAQVSGKADESYGNSSSSFGWSLTSSGFYLYSDSSTVMSVTSAGLTLSGTIYAVSGKIGGINLADYGLYTVDPEDETTVNLGISTDGYIYLTESGYILFQGKFTSSLTKETVQLMSYTSPATTGWNYTYVTQSDSATDLLIDTSNGITFTPTAVYSSNVETMGLGKDVSTGFTSSFANDGIKLGYKYYESSSLNGTLTALDIYTEFEHQVQV